MSEKSTSGESTTGEITTGESTTGESITAQRDDGGQAEAVRSPFSGKWFFPIALIAIGVLIYLTRGILLPFISGLAVAYLMDPVADKLEDRKVPRGVAAALVITLFFAAAIGILLAFWPILQSQLVRVAAVIPDMLAAIRALADQVMVDLSDRFTDDLATKAEGFLTSAAKEAFAKLQGLAGSLFQNGLALFNLLGLMVISPVVAFYLLRDWDHLVAETNSWLPQEVAPTVREQMSKIDSVLAGFVRGQLGICAIMGILYGAGWTLIGLDFGLLLGLLAGIMAFVPFVGVLVALVMALLVGVGQWGLDLVNLGMTVGIFVVVQALEGMVLTPRLVGGQVGLHPVWVLFAVLAGGELMGFLGVLISVPVAAVIAVLTRYALDEFRQFHNLEKDKPADGSSDGQPEAADDSAAESTKA